jgi:UDPglucose 6-dehydrogenase
MNGYKGRGDPKAVWSLNRANHVNILVRSFSNMKICVFGLWHLGCVTAACAAQRFPTIGLDPDLKVIAGLQAGRPPILEPGLEDLIRDGHASGHLRFTNDARDALAEADIVWVAFDTPVDEEDRPDNGFVESQIASLFPHLREGSMVLISSQLQVGTTSRIEAAYRGAYAGKHVRFAYSPENLRLGKALEVFRSPGRIVIGTRTAEDRERLIPLLTPFCDNLIWMSIESAEMTKHALNAFLANSIAFINEIATVCEKVGADAKQVEKGLKSDERIGPRAYLGAGGPFAGGTLARDISFLTSTASSLDLPVPLLESVKHSNDLHKHWPRRKLLSLLGTLAGKRIAVLGLTYKPGANTLRRSSSVELCRWLSEQHATVNAFDPAVQELPPNLKETITLADSALAAVNGCDAAVIATEWPEFRALSASDLIARMKTPIVLDANRFLDKSLGAPAPLLYIAVGMPKELA